MSKKEFHGVLSNPDIGCCPSCNKQIILPVGLALDELFRCNYCGAQSHGYKWLADNGKSAKKKLARFIKKLEEDIDKAAEI